MTADGGTVKLSGEVAGFRRDGQRGYFIRSVKTALPDGNTILTIIAGRLNYMASTRGPMRVPQPSRSAINAQ